MKRLAWILAAGAVLLTVSLPAAADDGNEPSVLVQTTALKKGSLPQLVVAYGTAQTNPAAHDSLMAPIAATVADVSVRVGQTVAKGDPLVELAPTPSTRVAYAAAVSAQRVAGSDLIRTRQLLGESLATGQQLAAAEKADSDARAALAALRAQGAAGPSIVRAPSPAIVMVVTAIPGAIVAEGSPLVELARQNGLVLVAGVVPLQATAIKAADEAIVTPLSGAGTFPAKVTLRGAAVDSANGLVPIHLSVPSGALLPGETAQASITTGRVNGFVVPHASILVHDNGDTYVVQAVHGSAKTVSVRVLASVDGMDVIDGPLDAAAPLILAGNYQLQDGMKVRLSNGAVQAGP